MYTLVLPSSLPVDTTRFEAAADPEEANAGLYVSARKNMIFEISRDVTSNRATAIGDFLPPAFGLCAVYDKATDDDKRNIFRSTNFTWTSGMEERADRRAYASGLPNYDVVMAMTTLGFVRHNRGAEILSVVAPDAADLETHLKAAATEFTAAAGIFDHVLQHGLRIIAEVPVTSRPAELNDQVLQNLIVMCLAEAQECTVRVAMTNLGTPAKMSLTAKLALYSSQQYLDASRGLRPGAGAPTNLEVPQLLRYLAAKGAYMRSLALYLFAKEAWAAGKYGLGVDYAQMAWAAFEPLIREFPNLSDGSSSGITAAVTAWTSSWTAGWLGGAGAAADDGRWDMMVRLMKVHMANVFNLKEEYVKDNDSIYFDTLPGETAVLASMPEAKPLAKLTPYTPPEAAFTALKFKEASGYCVLQ